MRWLDNLLNRITMYRLLLFVLLGFLGVATVLSWFGLVPYGPLNILVSAAWLVGVCWLVNLIFSWAWRSPLHNDSAYLTGLILALIISPYRGSADNGIFIWAPIVAMAGKYLLAINRQHIFNPAAVGVAMSAVFLGRSASWWVGSTAMLPVVLIGGFLVVRKIRRWDVVVSFLAAAIVVTALGGLTRGTPVLDVLRPFLISSPTWFFALIMLTEPLTMPPTHRWRLVYGVLIGILFAPQIHLAGVYSTPEYALLAGNMALFFFSRRGRYVLKLQEKLQLAPSVYEFVFAGPRPHFQAGQYLEWNLPHQKNDGRGRRRYFTVASSPTEDVLRLGVKFYPKPSTYKQTLASLKVGETIVAGQLDGDFVLPANQLQPLVFLAGGIGVTPFRSMIKYLLDRQERRPITMFYANQLKSDVVYHQLFDQAEQVLDIKTIYTLSDEKNIPTGWTGERGFITAEMIQKHAPQWPKALFFISGPQAMVTNYKRMLQRAGVPANHIKTDYFPGFA